MMDVGILCLSLVNPTSVSKDKVGNAPGNVAAGIPSPLLPYVQSRVEALEFDCHG